MTREERAKEIATDLTGLRPEGNMMWFLTTDQAPRQLTKAERILWKALVRQIEFSDKA